MIELPAALAGWAPQLAVLPSELALALASWVGRVAVAVGPLAVTERRHVGEPDGYRGLARRGSYERLVAAEWGVADLFPDEFIRRAAAGEHLFLDLARREPHGARRTIAIVSAGPAQLGAPRLAHVAALIVLARRAAAAGAGFAWGVLEDGTRRLRESLDEDGIRALLAARTATPAAPDAAAAWRSAFADEDGLDYWFIGAAAEAADAARLGASTLVVRDVLEPGARALDIEVDRRGRQARARLELPAPEQCVRLLRDPFATGAGSRRVAAAGGPALTVRFAPSSRRLIIGLADGSFEAWPVPTSPREPPGRYRRFVPPRQHQVIAIGVDGRALLAVTASTADPRALVLHPSGNPTVRIKLTEAVADALAARMGAATGPPIGTCGLIHLRAHRRRDLIIDVAGDLVVVPDFTRWPPRDSVLIAMPLAKTLPALATAFFRTHVAWATPAALGQVEVFESGDSGSQRVATLGARAAPDVQFGFALPRGPSWGAVSVAWDAGRRRIARPGEVHNLTLASPDPVVGVGMWTGTPGLVVRHSPNRLAWQHDDHRELLPASPAPIGAVAVCPAEPNVAWATATGEVVVYSLEYRAVLLRRSGAAG